MALIFKIMTLKEFIENLNEFVKENPETLWDKCRIPKYIPNDRAIAILYTYKKCSSESSDSGE